jgi:hypothetical protein
LIINCHRIFLAAFFNFSREQFHSFQLFLIPFFFLVSFTSNAQSEKSHGKCEIYFEDEINLPDEVFETSGLIYFEGNIWTINDGGNRPELICLDSLGKVRKKIVIAGSVNVDWEALSQDSLNIYIGDIGNNSGNRRNLQILAISKADLFQNKDSIHPQIIRFSYSNQMDFSAQPNHTMFDCEAMVSVGGSIYLFSKNWKNKMTYIYKLDKQFKTTCVLPLDSLSLNCLITDATYNYDSKVLLLLGYKITTFGIKSYIYSMSWNPDMPKSSQIFKSKLPFLLRQTEGLTLVGNHTLYCSSEGFRWRFIKFKPKLFIFKLELK